MKRDIAYVAVALTFVGLFVTMTVQAPVGDRRDPIALFNFRVEIDGVAMAEFRSVSGLQCETEVIEYRDGGDPNVVRLLPGLTRCGPIVLQWGVSENRELWDWYNEVINGNLQRKNGAVILMDASRMEKVRWTFYEAFPVKWEGPSLNTTDNGIAMESLTLAVERIERE